MAIAYDNSTFIGTTSTNHNTGSGANRVAIYFLTDAHNTTTAAYGGSAMTQLSSVQIGSTFLMTFYLFNPTTGSNAVTTSNNINTPAGTFLTYSGVAASIDSNATNSAASTTNISITGTTIANNAWQVAGSYFSGGTTYTGTNWTVRVQGASNSVAGGDSNGALTPAGSHLQTITSGSSSQILMSQVGLAPFIQPANGAFLLNFI